MGAAQTLHFSRNQGLVKAEKGSRREGSGQSALGSWLKVDCHAIVTQISGGKYRAGGRQVDGIG